MLNSTMNVYNLELVRNNEIRNYVTHKTRRTFCLLLTCYFIWHFFFITLMFVYLQKLLHCLIIYSYKTNPSFSQCPWNLQSIGPSDFKWTSKELQLLLFRETKSFLKYKLTLMVSRMLSNIAESHIKIFILFKSVWLISLLETCIIFDRLKRDV